MNQSSTIGELATALAAVQGKLRPAAENAVNPYFKSRYADLSSIWDACRSLMAANGLSLVQLPGPMHNEPPRVELTTMLMHKSGEWLSETLVMPLAKADPQGYGSAISYSRRYALAAFIGVVAGEDDDAESATRPNGRQQAQPTARKPQPKPQPLPGPPPEDPARRYADGTAVDAGNEKEAQTFDGYLALEGQAAASRSALRQWAAQPQQG